MKNKNAPKFAILFWFYKEPEICVNRLKLLQKQNPNVPIYGLYGGTKKDAPIFKKQLGKYLDDFYVSSLCEKEPRWKWLHGEQMIIEWFKKHGKNLSWVSVYVIQWDVLALDPLEKIFLGIKRDQICISGLRRMSRAIENRWWWTRKDKKYRKDFLRFREYVKEKYGYAKRLPICLFIFQVFPRKFFEAWAKESKMMGFLEYKIPTFAEIFKTPIYKKDLGAWWFDDTKKRATKPLDAEGNEISKEYILQELKKKNGYRIFHPYFKKWSGRA